MLLKVFVAATRQSEWEVAQEMKTEFFPLLCAFGRCVHDSYDSSLEENLPSKGRKKCTKGLKMAVSRKVI